MSATVCVCLRLIYHGFYRKSLWATLFYSNFFGDDPYFFSEDSRLVDEITFPRYSLTINWMYREDSMAETRRPIRGPIGSGRYELPVPGNQQSCKRQNKKRRQHDDDFDKCIIWKGAVSFHGGIKCNIAWATIWRAKGDSRKAGHKNTDNEKQDLIFPGKIHRMYSIVLIAILYYIVAQGQGFYEFGYNGSRSASHF